MSLALKADAIKKWFGGTLMVKEIDPDGTDLTSPDTFKSLSYIEEGEVVDETAVEAYRDETGEIVSLQEDNRDITLKGNFAQSDYDLLDFLVNTCRNKYYAVYRYLGVANGEHIEMFFGICKFKPQLNLKAGTKKPPFEIYVLNNPSAITIAAPGLPNLAKTTAEVVIAANAKYKIVKTAVS